MGSFDEVEGPGVDHKTSEAAQRIVLDIVRLLVGKPEYAFVTMVDNGNCAALTVHVSPPDRGKVIGRNGRTAQSLRTILVAIGKATGVKVSLDVESNPNLEHDVSRKP